MEQKDINRAIEAYTEELKLHEFKRHYLETAQSMVTENVTYEEYLLELLRMETEKRIENRRRSAIRLAGFPQLKYLQDIIREQLPQDARKILPQLERLDFIRSGQNVIFYGNPGTGKTHIATALGIKACMEGYKVLFTTVPRMLTQIRECRSQRNLRALELKFEKYDLVICDEFGYINFDKEGSQLLFNHLSLRAGKKATIITTNLSFDKWTEIFNDPVITAAIVDRLAHKAYMVNTTGNSFRVFETKNMRNQKI